MWDLIVSVPDHCLSFYFGNHIARRAAQRPAPSYLNLVITLLDGQYSDQLPLTLLW